MAAKLRFGRPLPDGTKVIVKPMRFKLTMQARRVADSIRPPLEPELDRIRAVEDRAILKVLDSKIAEADVVENFELMKAYVVSVIRVGQDLPHAKEHYAAVLYFGFLYGFWSEKYIKGRGNKGKLKAILVANINFVSCGSTKELAVLKKLYYVVNQLAFPSLSKDLCLVNLLEPATDTAAPVINLLDDDIDAIGTDNNIDKDGFIVVGFWSYTKYISADEKAKLPPEHQPEVKGINVILNCNKFYVKRVLVSKWDGLPEDLISVNSKFGADINWTKFNSLEEGWQIAKRAAGWLGGIQGNSLEDQSGD
eukprot:s9121_g1.t1